MTTWSHTARPAIGDERGVAVIKRWFSRPRIHFANTSEPATLARWLRRTANRTPSRDPVRGRCDVLLYERVAHTRTDLLDIADLLDNTDNPDPGCLATLREVLGDGCKSPLYNTDIHVSELRATLYYVRSALANAICEPDGTQRLVASRNPGDSKRRA
ncbi:MAG TPA: hypothetical protein VEF89_18505 [Solirubrobacteraceae bacterium]|nr:hypothetical protein [Solirubrobacteraceae bacterium]